MTDWARLRHLVLTPCHAIPRCFEDLDADASWFLKPYQSGEGVCYQEHVRAGVRLAAQDPHALLIFAGGQTAAEAGPQSEAQGYWRIAESAGWCGSPDVRARATTEEHSLDSFQNLLFGLCRFRECAGRYPEHVTVAGWEFKRTRFDCHRAALRYPETRFHYIGVNDPPEVEVHRPSELRRLQEFAADPYGSGPGPSGKRDERNPFRRTHGYAASCPEAAALLSHKGPDLFAGPLPWD